MKYLVLIPDGMADERIESLNDRTPMEAANKPNMDSLALGSYYGLVQNVPEGMVPESDTANMAILSFDPKVYSKGRSPLEAVSMGLKLEGDDVAIRANTVSLSKAEKYEDRIMLDNAADEITTEESAVLIDAVNRELADDRRRLYVGVAYRHCLIWNGADDKYQFARPHDIIGKRIGDYLPDAVTGKDYLDFMKATCDILEDHPLNIERKKRGKLPANSLWLWSPGKPLTLPSFADKFGLKATVISAVDLIKGIGICADMESVDVEGATGTVNTNYQGKAEAAINAFKNGSDLVYLHFEGPDEHGHAGQADLKTKSIELIDTKALAPILDYLRSCGEDFGIMILPDHPTPVRVRTHTREPVPYIIYSSKNISEGIESFTEQNCQKGHYIANGWQLMQYFLDICNK
ncbi:MAG: cofactor-independent phosphoglycerate mutase [Eubacteriales bacterium]